MKSNRKFQISLVGLSWSVIRYIFTALCLTVTTLIIAFSIQFSDDDYTKWIVTFVVGAFLGLVSQAVHERFFIKTSHRLVLIGIAAVLTIIYYFIISGQAEMDTKVALRTIILLFAALIAFLWIPVIKSKRNFNESFMVAFKAFFVAAFFAGVMLLGIVLTFLAINVLITKVDEKLYQHAANLIFVLVAPLYFLSLIPIYPTGKEKNRTGENLQDSEENQLNSETKESYPKKVSESNEEKLLKATTATRFLETLLSYVVIPVTAVYTVILLLYIVMNITGSFWTDSLLEPMLVTYSIVVIVVYLLASGLTNAVASSFRRVFPKVLVPIVLFQTISSVLRIGEVGVTYGRYYVILFGVFATVAGILFSFLPVQKNGIIAPILLVLALLSIIPPVDAFTLSRMNQTARLKDVLVRNDMLNGNTVQPNNNLSKEDKEILIQAVTYLIRMEDTRNVEWIPTDLNNDFLSTYGFSSYDDRDIVFESYYFYREQGPVPITGYDYMMHTNSFRKEIDNNEFIFLKDGATYHLYYERSEGDYYAIVLTDANKTELIRYEVNQEFQAEFATRDRSKDTITTEEATYQTENDSAAMKLVFDSINYSQWEEGENFSAEANVLIRIK
jgi:hypothetical protein